jgi:hypothetical protein
VQLGGALERAGVLREDGVVEDEILLERVHYDPEAARTMEATIRQEMRAEGMTGPQIETPGNSPVGTPDRGRAARLSRRTSRTARRARRCHRPARTFQGAHHR